MVRFTFTTLKRLNKPLRAVEYVISIGVLWATFVSITFASMDPEGPNESSFRYILERYEIVTGIFSLLAVLAVLDIIGLMSRTSKDSCRLRSFATFGMTIGLFFIAALSLFSQGPESLLWVNEFTLSIITSILYLNLKVNKENADR